VAHESEQGMLVAFAETVGAAEEQIVAGARLAEDELAEGQSGHHHPHLGKILPGQSAPWSAQRLGSEVAVGAEGQTAAVAGEQIAVG